MKKPTPKRYIADAKSFLKLARNEFSYLKWDFKGKLYAPVCFWAHQVAEKSLKAYLFYHGIGLIKKHKLEKELLVKVIKIDNKADKLKSACRFLDQFYIPVRYDIFAEISYSEKDAQKAIKSAKQILQFVEKQII